MKLAHGLKTFRLMVFVALMYSTSLFIGCTDDLDDPAATADKNTPANLTYPIVDTNQGLCYDNYA